MVIKKTKKVLLGFVTMSFILLVMVAATTTTATTTSLQQQDDNATTIDEPNIPIRPAEDEEPDEPIPDNENETDDDLFIPDPDNETDNPETWINWVRTPGGKDMPNGGTTTSTTVVVDFQGTVSGPGSHIDLKIDNGQYKPVASPRTITGLPEGARTIYLRAVDKDGIADPTPAKWRFTVIKDDDDEPPAPISITVKTDKPSYNLDEKVTVSGKVSRLIKDGIDYQRGDCRFCNKVAIVFFDPQNHRGAKSYADINPETLEYTYTTPKPIEETLVTNPDSGEEGDRSGTWKVAAIYGEEVYGGNTIVSTTTFEVNPEPQQVCLDIMIANITTDKRVYSSGVSVRVSGFISNLDRLDEDHVVKIVYNGSEGSNGWHIVREQNHGGCLFSFGTTIGPVIDVGTWTVRAEYQGEVLTTTFEVVEKPGPGQPPLEPDQDLDGDGLLNSWEQDGIDINQDGQVDLNLATLGADPYHKDVFVEIDYMEHHKPFDESISKLISIFADSPTQNPDGKTGISLHIELGDEISHKDIISRDEESSIRANYPGSAEQRSDANNENIITAKQAVYHYVLFAHHTLDQEGNPTAGAWACQYPDCKNILIAFGDPAWGTDPSSDHPNRSKYVHTAVLLHELGHNLGLYHGGFKAEKDVDNKPNYLSLMHAAFLYDVPILDYSGCELSPLDEKNLNEQEGIGQSCPEGRMTVFFSPFPTIVPTGVPVDWNHDGGFNDTGVIADINKDRKLTILHGHDDWSNLKFGKLITASTASSEQQQNQTMVAELLEFKKPDHFHDFMNEARESHKMQMDAIEYAIESFTNQSSNRTTTIDDEEEEQRVREANMLMEDVHEARSLVESDRLDNATARLEVIKEKVGAWNTDSTESESERRIIISLIDNVIESFEKIATPPLG
jgi:hypothetical protein